MVELKFPEWYTTPMAAVSNLGAGGLSDITLSDTSQGVLYGTFAITGLVSGGIGNSARLGVSAALLWSAQGAIMMSYPLEKDKGKAFAVSRAIFQFGSFIGSLIALAINIRSGGLSAVSTSTYIAFLAIIFVGVVSSFLVLPPNRVIRSDGTIIKLQTASKPHEEVVGMMRLFKDWRMLALVPMFFASNYFYAYQGAVNTTRFDGFTRVLNTTPEGVGAIIGALLIGYFVPDFNFFHRCTRGYLGLATVASMVIVIWSVALAWQVTFTCALAYWIMSAMTNDPFTLARYAGLYKALQSAGSASSFGMDVVKTPFLNEHLASWIMMLVSFPLAYLVIRSIKETNYNDEKMDYVDDVKRQAAEEGAAAHSAPPRADSIEKGSVSDREDTQLPVIPPASHALIS
ncbi:hypothetical protein C8Q78DRAFT_1111437 [Trametes maxima]|nr:hypothetical protein C8Q78DRAFT_1111437 [Trametes maxima]